MQKILSTMAGLALTASTMLGQDLPTSNIYLFQTEWRDSALLVKNPQFLTNFNKNGYNNQPSFLTNTELLVAVATPNDRQTDIYLLDLKEKTKLRLTHTAESEFSPKAMSDDLYFSVVRVETDNDRTQRLWQYPLDRQGEGKSVLRFLRGVGYYHWLDRFNVALFNVASVNFLSLADTRDGAAKNLSPSIGRCFGTSPNGRLVYVHKITENNWVIKALDKNTLETQEITKTLPGSEDFVVLKDGALLMGKGSRLYRYHPLKSSTWEEVVDLKKAGIRNISRLAYSADGKLAVVTE